MANTTSTSLKLTVQATGENSGTWGQFTNTNLLILEQAIGGYQSVGITTAATLTFSNGVLSNGKNQVLKLTGTISGNKNVVIPDSIEKTYLVENATTGDHTVTFKTTSGTGATWSGTDKGFKILYSDGTNVVDVTADLGNITTGTINSGAITTSSDITATGHILPGATDTYDLGSTSAVWRDIYTGDLHLSNEAKNQGNKVDGTKGNWTLQEGQDDIFMINNISGEKFKIKLEKV
jgi:hypothetical protein|tara:strand:- start:1600 stop:2304 length:705 start_codon:yes stop_codon:yes gene_type:complete